MKIKNILIKTTAIVIGFIIAFGIAEVGVRIISPQRTGPVEFAADPVLGDIMFPNQQGRRTLPGNYDFTYRNNSLGLRGDREYGDQKSGCRILVLGDSFTYGIGVNDDQTFAARLEQELAASNGPVEVINAGCAGKGTDYALKFFQTLGGKLKPDVTVLGFYPNDFEDNARGDYYTIQSNGELVAKPVGRDRAFIKNFLTNLPGYNWLISWSQAANLVKQAGVAWVLRKHQPAGGPAAGLVVSYRGGGGKGYADEQSRRATAVYLRQLQEAVQRAGSSLLIVYLPSGEEVQNFRGKHVASKDEQALQELVSTQGAAMFSLTPVLAASGESLRGLYYQEGHWTPAAHALAAQVLAEEVRRRLEKPGCTGKTSLQP